MIVRALENIAPPVFITKKKRWLNGYRIRLWTSSFRLHHLQIMMLNNGGPPIKLPYLWNTQVQAEKLIMTHPVKRWVKDSVGQFLHRSWQPFCHWEKINLRGCSEDMSSGSLFPQVSLRLENCPCKKFGSNKWKINLHHSVVYYLSNFQVDGFFPQTQLRSLRSPPQMCVIYCNTIYS